MRRALAAAVLAAAALLAPAATAAQAAPSSHHSAACVAVTSRHLTTITVTGLCPPRVRVQLARPVVVVGWDGENPIVDHDVPVAATRAHHGVVQFGGLSLGVQYEWRTVRGSHRSAWVIVNV